MKKKPTEEELKRIESYRRRIEKLERDLAAIIGQKGPRKPTAAGCVSIRAG